MSNDPGVEVLDGRRQAGALRAAKTLCVLVALGCAIAATTLLSIDDPYLRRAGWGWLANGALAALAFALLAFRVRWRAPQAEAVSLAVIAATLVSQVHSDWVSALSSARFAAFEGFKILALVVATVMPLRPAVAYALVGACAVMPVAVYAVMTPQMRAELPVEAPWTTTIYPVIATGILLYRARAARIEREMIRAQAQREELERLAKVSLAYRDLTNSPLQTLELLGAELRRQNPDSAKLVDVLERSLTRLRTLGEILSQSEDRVTWTSKEEAFDAGQVIAEFHRSA